jgi:two-component system sensor histidine kinase YesM
MFKYVSFARYLISIRNMHSGKKKDRHKFLAAMWLMEAEMHCKKFFTKLNNVKIREKLLLSYLFVVFLPVLLVGIIMSFNMRQMVIANAMKEANTNVDRTYSRFNEVLKLVMDISYKTRIDQNLEDLLVTKYTNVQEILDAYNRYTDFNTYANLYSEEINNIKFYTDNQTLIDNGLFTKINKEINQSHWFQKTLNLKGKIVWQYIKDESRDKSYLSLTSIINGSYGNLYLGVMMISINEEYLNNILRNEPYDTIICDDSGNILGSSNSDLTGKKLEQTSFSIAKNLEEGVSSVSFGGQPSKAVVKMKNLNLQNGYFKVISIVPVSMIEKETVKTAFLGVLIMLCSLLLTLIFILIFTNAISKRVKILSRDMHKVATGNFKAITVLEGGDEIGQLSKDLETMVKSIQDLILEVYEVNNQKNQLAVRQKEIEFKMLANQINPHFLFNALETIRMKAHCKGDAEIADVVKQLGKIMRRALEIGNGLVTLKSEIEMVASYLEIQRFRYGSKIQYEINIEHELEDYLILPLIIQPIVENSIVHGIEFKKGIGKVTVNAEEKNGKMIITVNDDGLGMEQERIKEVLNSLEDTTENIGRHIGIKNVHQRIKLCYGDGYGLLMTSASGVGTTVSLTIPGKG